MVLDKGSLCKYFCFNFPSVSIEIVTFVPHIKLSLVYLHLLYGLAL